MTLYRFQSTIQDASNLAKDRYVNTLHVNHDGGIATEAELTPVSSAIALYFMALDAYYPVQCTGGGHSVKAYDMSLPPGSRVPQAEVAFTLTGNEAPFPAEVALVVTLEANRVAGVEPMSTRGRMFIGPLASSAGASAADGHARPNVTFLTLACTKAIVMIDTINALPAMTVVIASTVQHKVKLADGARKAYPVLHVSGDDSWDTQRSRGDRATVRNRYDAAEQVLGSFTW